LNTYPRPSPTDSSRSMICLSSDVREITLPRSPRPGRSGGTPRRRPPAPPLVIAGPTSAPPPAPRPHRPGSEAGFSRKMREHAVRIDRGALGCRSRFGRERSSRKPSEAALEGGRQGLFRAQATRGSRQGRRPRAVVRLHASRRSRPPRLQQPPVDQRARDARPPRLGEISSASLASLQGAASLPPARRRCLPCAAVRPGRSGSRALRVDPRTNPLS